MSRLLFEDIFEVLDKDPDGKHFDKGVATRLQQATGWVLWHATSMLLQCSDSVALRSVALQVPQRPVRDGLADRHQCRHIPNGGEHLACGCPRVPRASAPCDKSFFSHSVQVQVGEKYSLALSSTLNLDGTPTEPLYNAVRCCHRAAAGASCLYQSVRLSVPAVCLSHSTRLSCCLAGHAEHAELTHGQLRLCHVWAHLQVQGCAVTGPGVLVSAQGLTHAWQALRDQAWWAQSLNAQDW